MGFEAADLSRDAFLGGRLDVWQPRRGYRAGADPVFLAASVPAKAGQRVLDLGCGAGVASLCLGRRVPGLDLWGLELQPDYAELARRNAAENGIALRVIEGDVAQPPAELRAESFDHVIANPPFFRRSGRALSLDPGRETGRGGGTEIALWIDAGLRRLRPGGQFTMIQRAERLPELLSALDGRAGSAILRPLAPRSGRPAELVILSARKGGRGAFRLLAPVILHDGAAHDGDRDDYSLIARAVLRDGAAWPEPGVA